MPAPALAVLRAGQQPVDDLLVGVRRSGRRETPLSLPARRQAGQVEVHAAQQGAAVGFGRGVRPRFSCSAAMKASIGLRTQAVFFTSADGGPFRGPERPVVGLFRSGNAVSG